MKGDGKFWLPFSRRFHSVDSEHQYNANLSYAQSWPSVIGRARNEAMTLS